MRCKINIVKLQNEFNYQYRNTLTNSFITILQYLCHNQRFGVEIIGDDVIYKIKKYKKYKIIFI